MGKPSIESDSASKERLVVHPLSCSVVLNRWQMQLGPQSLEPACTPEVLYKESRYGMTVERFNEGKSAKIYAEELKGT